MKTNVLEMQAILPRLVELQEKVGKPITVSKVVMGCSAMYPGFPLFMMDCLERHFIKGEDGLMNGNPTDHYFPFPDDRMEGGNPDPIINAFVIRDSAKLDTIQTFIGGELVDLEEIFNELMTMSG